MQGRIVPVQMNEPGFITRELRRNSPLGALHRACCFQIGGLNVLAGLGAQESRIMSAGLRQVLQRANLNEYKLQAAPIVTVDECLPIGE
jgi:hypothetical protein